jgi:hypothetical protein
MKTWRIWLSVLLAAAALAASGCIMVPGPRGRFDRALSVSGPVRIELTNGSGDVRITAGAPGQVRVQGDFELRQWIWEPENLRAEDYEKDPPIEQTGDVIRIGYAERWRRNVRVNYTIVVPPETSLRATSGSGQLDVRGLRGPVRLHTGSGDILAADIRGETQAGTGSGDVSLRDIGGLARADTGSGDVTIQNSDSDVRASTGSGQIQISAPQGRVEASTGSGNIRVAEASADARARTGSGDISVSGKPAGRYFWDLHASSGDIRLDLGATASFRLEARTTSGRIVTDVPLTIEEQSRRALRARAGSGEGRIEARTSSGNIRIQ